MSKVFGVGFTGKITPRHKVFLDTSVLLSALFSRRGGSFYILSQLKDHFEILINEYVLEEVLSVLNRKFPAKFDFKNTLFILLAVGKVKVLPNPSPKLVESASEIIEKEDAPILASAILESDFLVTLDKDFLEEMVQKFMEKKNIIICTPREFIKKWREK
ncbi:putative toxin-antitoxin system toxin component, PIN family [Candidatus Berkelbacteria bacterium]|nr:putative toxin-antitoxin system toxin component, PIN family [Candidatus Berkelbacteria bacterium]MBI2588382.1 putative toxin-antitoxin system toxin component, PIN family [Candidatus Berkelbacteria bacterium]MBI4029673.1 putative toxin-antitoxin system toxin component, PIN family [Candidatus Berkelbacteria bacterium]